MSRTVGNVVLTDLAPVSDLLNAPSRKLTWLTIIKASVAVAVAWEIASALPGDDAPLFAPIVALMTVQTSLYGTFAQGFQTVAGNIIGVALATGVVNLVGRTAVALSWPRSSGSHSRSGSRSVRVRAVR
jgi:hypothetical protein